MEKKIQGQLLHTKEQLRKNIYIFQHLTPDMTLKSKVIFQERHVAAISKDPTIILMALKSCPLVQVLSSDLVRVLVPGDRVQLALRHTGDKKLPNHQLKKLIMPLAKDVGHSNTEIKYESRETKGRFELQFQSEAAVIQFIERVKAKQLPLTWELREKNPYDCLKESIRILRKERKLQQKESALTQKNYNYAYYNPQQYAYTGQGQYQPFIRRAVPSSDEEEARIEEEGDHLTKTEEASETKRGRLSSEDFPEL